GPSSPRPPRAPTGSGYPPSSNASSAPSFGVASSRMASCACGATAARSSASCRCRVKAGPSAPAAGGGGWRSKRPISAFPPPGGSRGGLLARRRRTVLRMASGVAEHVGYGSPPWGSAPSMHPPPLDPAASVFAGVRAPPLRHRETRCRSSAASLLSLATTRPLLAPQRGKNMKSALLLSLLLGVTAVYAADPVVTPLMTKPLPEFPGKEVFMFMVEYPPGGSDPVHKHNAHGFIYVLEGSIVMGV